MDNYKKGDCVVTQDGFYAHLIKKLKDGYWEVLIPMGKYYKDIWHEEDFTKNQEEEE